MKIGIDIRSVLSTKTGVGHYTNCLCENIAKIDKQNNYDLFYFNFLRKKNAVDIKAENISLEPIRMLPGRICNRLWRYTNFPKGSWLLRKKDVVHFTNFTVIPGTKGKVVITVHDLSFIRYPQFTEPKNLKFLKKIFTRSLERADHIITVSEFSKNELMDIYKVPSEKITPVLLGVDDKFRQTHSENNINVFKEKYKTGDKYILSLGTLEPRKNIPTLIKAFDLMCEKNPDTPYNLVLTGMKGWLYEEIFASIKNKATKDKIIFTGYIDDDELPLIYQGASLFVCPSFYEGFGLPVAESMAAGVAVITSTAGSLVEVGGDATVKFNPEDATELYEKMQNVLSDESLRKDLITKGKKRAESFLWEKCAQETINVYKKI